MSLPISNETNISILAMEEANAHVKSVLEWQQAQKKRKSYTTYTARQQAEIGHYASEYRNAVALKQFRKDVPELGESIVRLFKKRYLENLMVYRWKLFLVRSADVNSL